MTTTKVQPTEPTPGPDVLREAARWFVLLASGEATDADRQRWQAWRAADARHEAGWRRAEAVTASFASLSQISQHQASVARGTLEQHHQHRNKRRRLLGGVAGAFIVGFAGWQGWRRLDVSADAVTAIGARRELSLADGSRLVLDTDTAVDLVFNDRERSIRLRRGRVFISTAKPSHGATLLPLWVETAEGRTQALGTRFSVQQTPDFTTVSVVEARVAIQTGAAGEAQIVAAGEAARFSRHGVVERRASPQGDSAWVRGMLVADDMPFAAFVAELARYRSAPLVCDPALRGLRISGTYPLTDIERVLAALPRLLPVRVQALEHGHPQAGQIVRPA
jgi:transmembrane sensor